MIKVLLFAGLKDAAGTSVIECDECAITVKQLKQYLKANHKGLGQISQVMVAINEEYAIDNDRVQCGDVVALIPPVSGG